MNKKINIIVATVIVFSSIILYLFVLRVNKEAILEMDNKQAQESKDSAKDDLEELNKNLPEGIKVEKKGGQQVLVNKKDGYEINVPPQWGEFKDFDYSGNKENEFSMGSKNTKDWVSISIFKKDEGKDIETYLRERFQNRPMSFYSPVILGRESIGNYEVIKAKDEDPILGNHFFYYIQKDSQIYEIYTDYSEESIRDVILNGNFDYYNQDGDVDFQLQGPDGQNFYYDLSEKKTFYKLYEEDWHHKGTPVRVKKVYSNNGKNYLDVDYINFFPYEEAGKAMYEDTRGECLKDEVTNFEGECAPLDGIWTRNRSDKIRTFEVMSSAKMILLGEFGSGSPEEATFKQFEDLFNKEMARRETPYFNPCWVEFEGGKIVTITEQYLP